MSDWSDPDSNPLNDVQAYKAKLQDPAYQERERRLNAHRLRIAQVDLLARHVRARHAIGEAMYRLGEDGRVQAWVPLEAYERLLVLAIEHGKPKEGS